MWVSIDHLPSCLMPQRVVVYGRGKLQFEIFFEIDAKWKLNFHSSNTEIGLAVNRAIQACLVFSVRTLCLPMTVQLVQRSNVAMKQTNQPNSTTKVGVDNQLCRCLTSKQVHIQAEPATTFSGCIKKYHSHYSVRAYQTDNWTPQEPPTHSISEIRIKIEFGLSHQPFCSHRDDVDEKMRWRIQRSKLVFTVAVVHLLPVLFCLFAFYIRGLFVWLFCNNHKKTVELQ